MRRRMIGMSMAVLLMTACQGSGDGGAEEQVASLKQAEVAVANKDGGARNQEMPAIWIQNILGRGLSDDVPPASSSPVMKPPPSATYSCPDDKVKSSDWPALLAAKQQGKQRERDQYLAHSPVLLSAPVPVEVAGTVDRQQRFLAAVEARKAELATMSEAERKAARAGLKAEMMRPAFQPNGMSTAGGYVDGADLPPIFTFPVTLQANHSYSILTGSLSTGADTVLHVQSLESGTGNGHFIAGNDDAFTNVLYSWVVIPASASDRSAMVVVRDYSPGANHGGSAELTILDVTASTTLFDHTISFTGGYRTDFDSFPLGTHFFTAETAPTWMGGNHNSVMLVLSNSVDHGMEYNDDFGVDLMSWIHTDEACSSNCAVIAASWSSYLHWAGVFDGMIYATRGTARFVWDEEIHDAATYDPDGDGLGNTLEAAIGTSGNDNDSDDDGINDRDEFMGRDKADASGHYLLKFPMYGADPTVRDLFVEADWIKCTRSSPTDTRCDTAVQQDDPDAWRMSGSVAQTVAQYFAPDVALHFDIGEQNTDLASGYIYNDWGGATVHDTAGTDWCEWLSLDRTSSFHAAHLEARDSNAGWGDPGNCIDARDSAMTIAHELGHNLNLTHGAKQSGGLDINCKPNYLSIMNYAYEGLYDPSSGLRPFSENYLSGKTLNPAFMNEVNGLGTTDSAKLQAVTGAVFNYPVDPVTGSIDWNRDGRIETGLVRAAATFGSHGCGAVGYQADNSQIGTHDTALSYLPWPVGNPRLYWFTRRDSDGKIQYRYATSFPENCGTPPPASCRTNWSPGVASDASTLSSSLDGSGAPAAGWYTNGIGKKQLVLVYKDTGNHLRYQVLTPYLNLAAGWIESWTAPAYVGSGSETIAGSPAVIGGLDGKLHVYAIVSGVLNRWTMDGSGSWTGPTVQQWDDATDIEASYGIGLAKGYLQQGSAVHEEHVFAAIPSAVVTIGGGTYTGIDLAWRDEVTGKWTRLDDSHWGALTRIPTQDQPALAYEPFDRGTNLYEGRFYLLFNPYLGPSHTISLPAVMTFSEGNDLDSAAADRRFVFTLIPQHYNLDSRWPAKGNMSLIYDLDIDHNVRGAYTRNQGFSIFSPAADGIFNADLKDQDDYVVLRSNLRCALGLGSCL